MSKLLVLVWDGRTCKDPPPHDRWPSHGIVDTGTLATVAIVVATCHWDSSATAATTANGVSTAASDASTVATADIVVLVQT